jgi:signal transduction histidine kinase
MSEGDYSTPVPVPGGPLEAAALASALEKSRMHVLCSLERLTQANVWAETLLSSIAEGIVTIDHEGRITSFNYGAERITGWTADEVLQASANQVFRMPVGEGLFLASIPEPGSCRRLNILDHNRQLLTLAVTAATIRPSERETEETALVLRDMTTEEAAQKMRNYFVVNVTHEFREPLAALNATAGQLGREVDELTPEEIRRRVTSMQLSILGLQTLASNLLESTGIETGLVSIQPQATDLRAIIAEAIQITQPEFESRRQRLVVEEPPELPPVMADRARLDQVMVNLLSNASEFSPQQARIDLSVEVVDDGLVRIAVADRGPGVPPAERAALFRHFLRLGTVQGTQYGIGLGLSVVKAIVEAHGGEVGVDERPGGGSIFWVTIPIATISEAAAEPVLN